MSGPEQLVSSMSTGCGAESLMPSCLRGAEDPEGKEGKARGAAKPSQDALGREQRALKRGTFFFTNQIKRK